MPKNSTANSIFPDGLEPSPSNLQMLATFILACNRQRTSFLPEIQWGERAWDLLLEIYVLSAGQSYFGYEDIGKHPKISPSIDKRYFAWLVEEGLLESNSNGENQFLTQYQLSGKAKTEIESWLAQCLDSRM